MPSEDLAEENLRVRKLRLMVDATAAILHTRPITRYEAEEVVAGLRHQVLLLFPDSGGQFDLIYAPRFQRLIDHRWGDGQTT